MARWGAEVAVISKKKRKVNATFEITFECDPPGANQVALVCDAHGWESVPMRRSNRGRGPFRTRLALPEGDEAQFRYLVDGTVWLNDEAADAYVANEFGSDNSVVAAR